MRVENKTKDPLIDEVQKLRQKFAEFETSEIKQKKTKEALRESENRYKSLYLMVRLMCDNVPDLIWAKDLEKRYIFANKAICEKLLNAKDTDEPIGKTDLYFANRERSACPADPNYRTFGVICTDSDSVVLKSMKPERFNEFGNVKGQFLFLDVYKAPFWDEKGDIIGTVGCGREVTKERQIEEERKCTEEALKESEKKYRYLVDNSFVGIYITENHIVRFCNQRFAEIFGYGTPREFVGIQVSQLVAPGSWELVDIQVKLRESGQQEISRYEFKGVKKDGTILDIEVLEGRITFEGKPAVQGTMIDITKQRRMEEILRESEKRYRGIFEHSPIAISEEDWSGVKTHIKSMRDSGVKDFSTYLENHPEEVINCASKVEIIDVNNATLDLYGAATKKEYFSGIEKTFTKEYYESFKKILICLAKGKTSIENEFLSKTLKGDQKYIRLKCSMAPSYQKTLTSVFVSALDFTDRKRMEEALRESEAKLREQKSALEKKNIALSEIIAQVELEKRKIRDDIKSNVRIVISPILKKLNQEKDVKKYVNLLQHQIEELTSSYGIMIEKKGINLSPREIEVCNLVRGGLSSKDISKLLDISCRTVEKHREQIRRKLMISNKHINLTSFLNEF